MGAGGLPHTSEQSGWAGVWGQPLQLKEASAKVGSPVHDRRSSRTAPGLLGCWATSAQAWGGAHPGRQRQGHSGGGHD